MTEVQRSGLVSPGWHAIPPMGWNGVYRTWGQARTTAS
jgi:hypothetical protein